MPKEHISASNAVAVAIVAILLALGGLAVGFLGLLSLNGGLLMLGVVMFFMGLFIGGVNKLAFKTRTTQLSIDTKEAVKDKLRNVCSNCGARNPEGSKFCSSCGYKIVAEKEIVREREVLIKVRCPYCHKLYDETLDLCPHCGGRR